MMMMRTMSMSIMIDGHAVSAGGSDDEDDGDDDEDDDGGVKKVEVLLSPRDGAGRVVIAGDWRWMRCYCRGKGES